MNYSADRSNFSQANFNGVSTPPNAPYPFDSTGQLVWSEKGAGFENPFAQLNNVYLSDKSNIIGSGAINYRLLKGLFVRINAGFTQALDNENTQSPKSAQNPLNFPVSGASFANAIISSWIAEPQVEWVSKWNEVSITLLGGLSMQAQKNRRTSEQGYDYPSDDLLGSLAGARLTYSNLREALYRYQGVFSRLNINLRQKYIVNLSARRDGSSRFGPGRQFANFGAAGLGWLFQKEAFMRSFSWLSFGKLRMSYGLTGNDQIGDYRYLDTWGSNLVPYNGVSPLFPLRHFNNDYAWEVNRKFETGLELGFFHDRLLASISYYNNRSGNQLIDYTLPSQTGFGSVLRNFNALVENKGVEGELNATIINKRSFHWTATGSLSVVSNRLLRFPGLDSSSYASQYTIGRSINSVKGFAYLGVSPKTGLYTFNGSDYTKDITSIKNVAPVFYGGIANTISFRGWELYGFIQFSKQPGFSYLSHLYNIPGSINNQPVQVLDRWQKPGDIKPVELFTTIYGDAAAAYYQLHSSDAQVTNASFARLKTLSVSYTFSQSLARRWLLQDIKLFAEGQNLFLLTRYGPGDPESNGGGNPLVKTFTAGLLVHL